MIHVNYLLLVALLLLVYLVYKEWNRKRKSWLFGRLAASLLAVSGIFCMAFPFAEKNTGLVNKIVILTKGFEKDSIDNFLRNNNGADSIFTDASEIKYAGKHTELVTDWLAFAATHAADTLHVFGSGLDNETLTQLRPHPIVFHAAAVPGNFSHIYWKQWLETGEPLVVQGSYENNTHKKIKIVLQSFGAARDSVFIDAGQHDFELHAIPVHQGRAVYSLIAAAGNDTLQKEPVPLNVQTNPALRLLIISSSPDFENSYLKNYLSQNGFQVTMATTVSTNKTNRQFLNMPAQQKGSRLTISYLDKFDVLVTDQSALQTMDAAELSAVRNMVQENGAGLLIKMDGQKISPSFYNRFFPVHILQQKKDPVLQLYSALADSSSIKIKIEDPVSIGFVPGTQTILQDAQSNIYASAVLYGSGRMVATTLQNTFSMALAGNKSSYRQLWWLLLNKAAKKNTVAKLWQARPFLSFVNAPATLEMEKTTDTLLPASINQTTVYMEQDRLLSFVGRAVYWPVEKGWQQLFNLSSGPGNWYVYNNDAWKGPGNYQRMEATKAYVSLYPVVIAKEKLPVNKTAADMRPWLFIIFLACCIFLWVEQKTG